MKAQPFTGFAGHTCRTNGHTRAPHAEASPHTRTATQRYNGLPEVFMKLRRAMALAAATAAIAPLALLSAPAAFAEETPSPTATVSETASEPASATPTETTPAPT